MCLGINAIYTYFYLHISVTELYTDATLAYPDNEYDYTPSGICLVNNTTHMLVSFRGSSDAIVLLSAQKTLWTGNLYMVTVGGFGNTKTFIRTDIKEDILVETPTSMLDDSRFVDLWMSWDLVAGGRLIQVGTGSIFGESKLVDYLHPAPVFEVNYIAVGTGYEASGGAYWKITY